jgi:hypothetical protein
MNMIWIEGILDIGMTKILMMIFENIKIMVAKKVIKNLMPKMKRSSIKRLKGNKKLFLISKKNLYN